MNLAEKLAERCSGPVEYGVNDCVPLCADHLLEMTGRDLMAQFRGAYGTREERDALLSKRGLLYRVQDEMRDQDEWRRIEPEAARDPALGLAQVGSQWLVCVALGGGWWATRSDDGLAIFDASHVRRAWQWG